MDSKTSYPSFCFIGFLLNSIPRLGLIFGKMTPSPFLFLETRNRKMFPPLSVRRFKSIPVSIHADVQVGHALWLKALISPSLSPVMVEDYLRRRLLLRNSMHTEEKTHGHNRVVWREIKEERFKNLREVFGKHWSLTLNIIIYFVPLIREQRTEDRAGNRVRGCRLDSNPGHLRPVGKCFLLQK